MRKQIQMNTRIALAMLFVPVLPILAGCIGIGGKPSVTVHPTSTSSDAIKAPSMIYITDFYLPPQMIQSAQSLREQAGLGSGPLSKLREDIRSVRDNPEAKAKQLVKTLGETITSELKKSGYKAEYRPSDSGLR